MKIVVIGAAPTGLGVAYRLNQLKQSNPEAKDIELSIIEQSPNPGGLSSTIQDENGFLWDYGIHITFSHNFPYYEEATRWAVKDWNQIQRNCMADMSHIFDEKGLHLVPYPAQFAVPLFPEDIKQKCLNELVERYKETPAESPRTFEDWIIQNFGPTFLEIFFKPYNSKLWTVSPEKMNPTWVGTRVAKLPRSKLEELCMLDYEEVKKADFGWGPNAYFSFPTTGGTGTIWLNLAEKLPKEWFFYNTKVDKIDVKDKRLFCTNLITGEENSFDYDILINTAPIDILIQKTRLCKELNLIRSKTFIVGIGLKNPMPKALNNINWLYFPDPNVPFYRVTIFSSYADVTPDKTKYWSIMCEIAKKCDDLTTKQEIEEKTIQSLISKSFFQPEQIVSCFSMVLNYGYPVPSLERDAELARAHRVLEQHRIYSRGRFGGWKYEASNQDHCFMQGKEILDWIVFGTPEKVYLTGIERATG